MWQCAFDKVDARKYSLRRTYTPLTYTIKHMVLLARVTYSHTTEPHNSLTIQTEAIIHVGVHNTCLVTFNHTLHCPMCGQLTSNGHIARNCPSKSCLRQEIHNSALQLLLSVLERYNGG
jgi:hypothetical protein